MNIQTDAIQVSFGSKTILHDISLAIQDKESLVSSDRMAVVKVHWLSILMCYCNLQREMLPYVVLTH